MKKPMMLPKTDIEAIMFLERAWKHTGTGVFETPVSILIQYAMALLSAASHDVDDEED